MCYEADLTVQAVPLLQEVTKNITIIQLSFCEGKQILHDIVIKANFESSLQNTLIYGKFMINVGRIFLIH